MAAKRREAARRTAGDMADKYGDAGVEAGAVGVELAAPAAHAPAPSDGARSPALAWHGGLIDALAGGDGRIVPLKVRGKE